MTEGHKVLWSKQIQYLGMLIFVRAHLCELMNGCMLETTQMVLHTDALHVWWVGILSAIRDTVFRVRGLLHHG